MKVAVLIENPEQDKELLEPLIQKFRSLILNRILGPCLIESDGVEITITPRRVGRRSKENKKRKQRKVA